RMCSPNNALRAQSEGRKDPTKRASAPRQPVVDMPRARAYDRGHRTSVCAECGLPGRRGGQEMALATSQPSPVQQLAVKLAGPPNHDDGQDVKTVKILRLCVGVIGTSLPITLIIWNAIKGAGTIVPASMSGTYYTSARNLFVGSLCALGVFL